MKSNPMMMAAKAVEQVSSGPEKIGLWDRLYDWASGDDFLQTSGLGGTEYPYCEFIGTYRVTESAKQIQQLLKEKGVTNLVIDGLWGPCTDSAFQNVFGEPLTKESLKRLLGVDCKQFNKQVTGKCTNGTDVVFEPQLPAPAAAPPTGEQSLLSLFQMKSPVTQQRTLVAGAANLRVVPPPTEGGALQTLTGQTSQTKQLAIAAVIVVAVAGAAYLYKNRK